MFKADNPLRPPKPVFDEAWQAQSLALADAMVQAGIFTATEWATALGTALKEANHAPDTLETYYMAVVSALENLSEEKANISTEDRARRRAEWEAAYDRTPHGMPVEL